MQKALPEISIVVPLFNEASLFNLLIERLNKVIEKADFPIEVILVDDGSSDNTATLIRALSLGNPHFKGVLLSRNFGHQVAVSAGIANSTATKALLIIDGDLQDPPELLFQFYSKLKEGYDVVYAIRKKRKEKFIKRLSYYFFYRLQQKITNINVQIDSGDFCIMSARVAGIIMKMPEQSRYLRGLRSWVGFKQVGIEYEREERASGNSKYSFKMLLKLAYNGIFNFSELPVKFITSLGLYSILLGLIYLSYSVYRKYVYHDAPKGFAGLLSAIIMFSGAQLLSIGILGEYIIRIFMQSKGRPLYVISEIIENCELKKSNDTTA